MKGIVVHFFLVTGFLLSFCSSPNSASQTGIEINVDSCGANPWDLKSDSDAIQACIDSASNGDTVTFTSGVKSPGYHGYLINKTIFLVATHAKNQ